MANKRKTRTRIEDGTTIIEIPGFRLRKRPEAVPVTIMANSGGCAPPIDALYSQHEKEKGYNNPEGI